MTPDALGAVFGQTIIPALGRAILHSLWQITLVASFTALALVLLRRAGANARYLTACIGLTVSLALTVATFVVLDGSPQPQHPAGVTSIGGSASPANGQPDARPVGENAAATGEGSSLALALDAAFPWLVGAWALGVLLLSFRLFGAWWAVIRLVRRRTTAPRAEWRHLCDRMIDRAGITRAVRVLESAAVAVPTVIGWMRPVLLLPVSAMSGLTLPQVEAILAHELAHVRRHDYLVNLFQSAIETLLFYHPAVWWLSARIRSEREHCCDDAAVALTGDPIGYARALTTLEARRLPALKLAAAANGGPLMRRIVRLRQTTGRSTTQPGWLLPLFVVFFVIVALASATAVRAAYNEAPRAGARCDRGDTAALGRRMHPVTRRMTVVESLAWRLPLAVRREIVSLGLAGASSVLADKRQICVRPALTLWDQLLPVMTEFEPALNTRDESGSIVATDGTAAQDPAVAADLEAARRELERARAAIRSEMEQVQAELRRSLPPAAECQVRAAQEAMRRALDETRRQQAEIDRQMHGAARERAASDWRDAERALAQAQERVRRELDRTQQLLQRRLRAQDLDRLEQQLHRRMQEMDREMKRSAEQLNRRLREMPRVPDLPDRAPLPDVPDVPASPDFTLAPLPPEPPPVSPVAREIPQPPPVPPAPPAARVPRALAPLPAPAAPPAPPRPPRFDRL